MWHYRRRDHFIREKRIICSKVFQKMEAQVKLTLICILPTSLFIYRTHIQSSSDISRQIAKNCDVCIRISRVIIIIKVLASILYFLPQKPGKQWLHFAHRNQWLAPGSDQECNICSSRQREVNLVWHDAYLMIVWSWSASSPWAPAGQLPAALQSAVFVSAGAGGHSGAPRRPVHRRPRAGHQCPEVEMEISRRRVS